MAAAAVWYLPIYTYTYRESLSGVGQSSVLYFWCVAREILSESENLIYHTRHGILWLFPKRRTPSNSSTNVSQVDACFCVPMAMRPSYIRYKVTYITSLRSQLFIIKKKKHNFHPEVKKFFSFIVKCDRLPMLQYKSTKILLYICIHCRARLKSFIYLSIKSSPSYCKSISRFWCTVILLQATTDLLCKHYFGNRKSFICFSICI